MDEECREILDLSIKYEVLRFGDFTLKSGKKSPYFFNIGNFSDGDSLYKIAQMYASKIQELNIDFDLLLGIAYKGIPLVACISIILKTKYNKNINFVYSRNEDKTHGEKGCFVGNLEKMKGNPKILLIDDVLTAGTAIFKLYKRLKFDFPGLQIAGVLILFDRYEPESLCAFNELNNNENKQDISQNKAFKITQDFKNEFMEKFLSKNIMTVSMYIQNNFFPIYSIFNITHVLIYLKRNLDKNCENNIYRNALSLLTNFYGIEA